MAYDPNQHEIHPQTGFIVDKETGHPVGLAPAPHRRVNHDDEWPKWVKPHESHVVVRRHEGAPDHVSAPGWEEVHVGRDGVVTVLVRNEDEEAKALAAREEPHAEEPEAQPPVPVEARDEAHAAFQHEPEFGAQVSAKPKPKAG